MGCCCTVKSTPSLASRNKLSSRVHGGTRKFDPGKSDSRAPLTSLKEEEPHDLALEKRLDEMIAEIEKDEVLFSIWHRKVMRTLRTV